MVEWGGGSGGEVRRLEDCEKAALFRAYPRVAVGVGVAVWGWALAGSLRGMRGGAWRRRRAAGRRGTCKV